MSDMEKSIQDNDILDDEYPQALCDSWSYTPQGGYLDHNGVFYEIQRVPDTLSDQIMNGEDFGLLPETPAAGVLIIGDQVNTMNVEQVKTRKISLQIVEDGDDLIQLEDGTWSTQEDIEAALLTAKSEVFKSLPLITVDSNLHYAKFPRSILEIQNLIAVKGLSHVVQVVGRTEDGKVVTERFGQTLATWVSDRSISVPEEWKLQWSVDIVLALFELHRKGILHKDLTMRNALISDQHAILCDLESGASTWNIQPPEFVQKIKTEFNEKMDIYGLGVLLWSIENRNFARSHRTLQSSGPLEHIISKCLSSNPDDRPTLAQVISELQQLPVTQSLISAADLDLGLPAFTSTNSEEKMPSSISVLSESHVTDESQNEISVFCVNKPRDPVWKDWLYTKTGATLTHQGIFYDITRIPGTYSCRIINQKADLPIVPWPGARIIGDRVEKMTQQEIDIRKQELGTGMEVSKVQEEADALSAHLAIDSEVFKSLPSIKFDKALHHAKVPRSIQEIVYLQQVKGQPYLVQLVGRGTDNTIITKKFGTSLTELLAEASFRRATSDKFKLEWAIDAARGLSILHRNNILHKDLCTNNILIEGDRAILCDLESQHTIACAVPPECTQGGEFDKAADIYGFGTLLWSIENTNMPRPHASLESNGIFKDILPKCLAIDPAKRATIDEILVGLEELSTKI